MVAAALGSNGTSRSWGVKSGHQFAFGKKQLQNETIPCRDTEGLTVVQPVLKLRTCQAIRKDPQDIPMHTLARQNISFLRPSLLLMVLRLQFTPASRVRDGCHCRSEADTLVCTRSSGDCLPGHDGGAHRDLGTFRFVTPTSLLQPKYLVCFLLYGLNMELILWFPGNLEIRLRYDFNIPFVEDLFESGTLHGHSGRLAEAKQLILSRFRQEPHVFLIVFPCFS